MVIDPPAAVAAANGARAAATELHTARPEAQHLACRDTPRRRAADPDRHNAIVRAPARATMAMSPKRSHLEHPGDRRNAIVEKIIRRNSERDSFKATVRSLLERSFTQTRAPHHSSTSSQLAGCCLPSLMS